MSLERILETEILPLVDKPSRYLGNEVNAVGDSLSKAGPGKHLATPLPWRGPR